MKSNETRTPCLTCDLISGTTVSPVDGGTPIHQDDVVLCNHYVGSDTPGDTADSRAGWLIVSPVRHLTRIHQLTGDEWKRLGTVIRAADKALTELYGAGRCLVSSLGWYRQDHIHFHIVPTALATPNPETGAFDPTTHPEITHGWLNFGGPTQDSGGSQYVPVCDSASEVSQRVRRFIQPRVLGRLPHHYGEARRP